ncbi:MAG TPA: serine hydrolase domain-containing protein [Steroidobacteraceae bacterium]|nr:serine hydrolase domain-containing protein [Steroidobacteraceae bacterium]
MRLLATTTALVLSAYGSCAVAEDAPAPQLTRADVEAWLDGYLPYAINSGDIAGAVIVVVKDGEVLAQKGYGYADVATKKPVDPERTMFRAGSVAKLVTHTAVMQLVEQGKLDLDADIAQYLDFPIEAAYGKPITLHNLMTHTGGFEELVRGLMASDPKMHMPLETYVKATHPSRIFPPGEVPSYCNYCVTLEGYIVQRVSGESFDDYLDKHIFAPLGMSSSTFRQPLPKQFEEQMSTGYPSASQPAGYFELVGPAPAGSLSTTGVDMARFMIAEMKAYSGADTTLLGKEAAQRMQTRMFRPVPPSAGMAVGFFERDRNGHRIREHEGDTQFFHSRLAMFMDDGVGVFMSFNSSGKEGAAYKIRESLLAKFADRYFPAPLSELAKSPDALAHAQVVSGRYAASRRAETTFFKLFTLLGQSNVMSKADGALTVPGLDGLNGQPREWYEVAPFVWRDKNGPEQVAVKMDGNRVQMLSADEIGGVLVMLPVPWQQSSAWILPVIGIATAILVLTVLAWPIAAWRRRRRGTPLALSPRELSIYRIARVVALIDVAFLLGWMGIVSAGNADLAAYDGRLDTWFYVLHALGLIGAVGAIVALWNGWLAVAGKRGWRATTWNVGLAASCVAVTWFAFAFHLIRFTLKY